MDFLKRNKNQATKVWKIYDKNTVSEQFIDIKTKV